MDGWEEGKAKTGRRMIYGDGRTVKCENAERMSFTRGGFFLYLKVIRSVARKGTSVSVLEGSNEDGNALPVL